jgi:DNA (cytosine-5)-methyltransferase 1
LRRSVLYVPQKRKRVFIVGLKKDLFGEAPNFQFPVPSSRSLVLRDVLESVPASEGYSYPERKRVVMDLVPPGGCWIDLPEDVQKQYMGNALNSGGGKRGMARRLSMDEPSLTLTTSPCQKQTERCHPLETRPLNVREYARIQTFPDDYVFKGNIASKYRQIGNAVPVELAKAIGGSIVSCFSQTLNNT